MALLPVNIGAAPNDGSGDPLRTAFSRTNTNTAALGGGYQTPTALAAGGTALSANKNYSTNLATNVVYQPLPAGEDGDWISVTYNVTAPSSINLHTNSTVYQIGGGQITAPIAFSVGTHRLALRKAGGRWVAECSVYSPSAMITAVGPGGGRQVFTAAADTNAARVAALSAAIAAVPDGGKIVLEAGSYILGVTLASLGTHTNWKLEFHQGAWLAYTLETLAEGGDFAYEGTERRAWEHGIFPGGTEDMQPRIQAALFSMPGGGVGNLWPADCLPHYPGMVWRTGTLLMRQASYNISKPVYACGHQQIYSVGGREVVFDLMDNFAPDINTEVFAIKFVRAEVDLGAGMVPASDFAFNFRLLDVGVSNTKLTNPGCSALIAGGAQGTSIKRFRSYGMKKRGVVMYDSSAYFEIDDLYSFGDLDQTGPHLEMNLCTSFRLGKMQLLHLNNRATGRKSYDGGSGWATNLGGVFLNDCRNFTIESSSGEQMGTQMRLFRCFNFECGPVTVLENNDQGAGETMVLLRDCSNYSINSFSGKGFEKLYRVLDGGGGHLLEYNSNNATFDRAPGITDGLRHAGPVTSEGVLMRMVGKAADITPAPPIEPIDQRAWLAGAGLDSGNYFYGLYSYTASGDLYNHIFVQTAGNLSGNVPSASYTMALDPSGQGAISIGKILNVGWAAGAAVPGACYAINNVKVIGSQGAAVANATDAASAITQLNALLARLRASTGHGLIAG